MSKAVEHKDEILERSYNIFKEKSKENELITTTVLRTLKDLVMPYQFNLLEEEGKFQKIDDLFEKNPLYYPQKPNRLYKKIENYDCTEKHDLGAIKELLLFSYMMFYREEIIPGEGIELEALKK